MRTVSIVGKAPGFEKYLEADGDTWCVSSVFKQMDPDRVQFIFNLHKPDAFESWLSVEFQRVYTAFPGPYRQFPIDNIVKKYGLVFGSSVSWMIALAIENGYEKINIFGVEMGTKEEYFTQRDSFFYMCGRAEALNIEIYIPKESRTFFKYQCYGVT